MSDQDKQSLVAVWTLELFHFSKNREFEDITEKERRINLLEHSLCTTIITLNYRWCLQQQSKLLCQLKGRVQREPL